MDKEGRLDKVYLGVEGRGNQLRTAMQGELKGKKPFRQEPVSPAEQLGTFDTMSPEAVDNFIMQNGMEAWMALTSEMDKIRRRQIKSAMGRELNARR